MRKVHKDLADLQKTLSGPCLNLADLEDLDELLERWDLVDLQEHVDRADHVNLAYFADLMDFVDLVDFAEVVELVDRVALAGLVFDRLRSGEHNLRLEFHRGRNSKKNWPPCTAGMH